MLGDHFRVKLGDPFGAGHHFRVDFLGTFPDCRSFLGQFGDHFEGEDHFGVRDHFMPVYSVPLNLHT